LRLLIGLALQIGLTLENYLVMHDSQRRTKEYELLTQIGQVISSRLDQDEVLRAIQEELGRIFDTTNFYVAFRDGDNLRFELEIQNGVVLPKRSRKLDNGLTEHIIRTGEPLLIRSDVEKARERLGATFVPKRPSKSFCGVPVVFGGKSEGAMVATSPDREYVFEDRDLEILKTAAGQVSVAVENARLFGEEQRRSKQFAFLNNISKTAISSEDAEQMLAEIVGHIQRNFNFDHIGIGILDYATKDIEIKAEAGTTAKARSELEFWDAWRAREKPRLYKLRVTVTSRASCRNHAPFCACPLAMARHCWECSTSRAGKRTLSRRRMFWS
jgi:transcriptional regulator with GAF, ATPase, and Fis domain